MAGATTTTLTSFIETYYNPEVRKTFFEGLPFLSLFGTIPAPRPGDSMDWRIHYSGQTAVNYSEGHTPPAAGYNSYATPTLAYKYAWATAQITGHAIDALKGGSIDPVVSEIQSAVNAVKYKCEQNVVASFIAAIDDTSTYGGVTRSTAHLDSTDVAGGSAALSLAMLGNMHEPLKLSARCAPETESDLIIVSSFEQIKAYTELAGVQYNEYNMAAADSKFDLGRIKPTISYNNIPWYCIPTLTNTYVFLTRKNDVVIEEKRPITVEVLAKVDDSQTVLVTAAMELRHMDPYRASRISALTT